MAKHTPGPWVARKYLHQSHEPRWSVWPTAQGLRSGIAEVYSEPDARLIAAAPELYAELREWTRGLQSIAEGRTPGRSLTPWEQERLSAAIDLIADVEGIR